MFMRFVRRVCLSALVGYGLVSSAVAQEAVTVKEVAPGVFMRGSALTMAPIADEVEAKVTKVASADTGPSDEAHCLATAIYFEARGESAKGQRAVAEVILARTRVPGRPKTVCGVVFEGSQRKTGCQFSFTCDGLSDVARGGKAWAQARKVAAKALKMRGKKVSRGATFYHAHYVKPRWAKGMVKVARIGSHVFYRPKRGRLL